MSDNFSRLIITGIFICLLVIAFKSNNTPIYTPLANSPINFDLGYQVIQLASNRVAVADNRTNSGTGGTILIFDYDQNSKKFTYVANMNYSEYFKNPQNYGLILK